MPERYDIRNFGATGNTISVIDGALRFSHTRGMVTHDDILAELRRWISSGKVSQREVAAELGVAPPRINEVLNERRC